MKRYIALAFIFSVLSLSVFSSTKENVSLQSIFDSYQTTVPLHVTEKEPSDYSLKDALKGYSDSFLPEMEEPSTSETTALNRGNESSEAKEKSASIKESPTANPSQKQTTERKKTGKETKEELPYFSRSFDYEGFTVSVSVYKDHTSLIINSYLYGDYSSLISYLIAYYLDLYEVSYSLEGNQVTIYYPELSDSILDLIVSSLSENIPSSQEMENMGGEQIPRNTTAEMIPEKVATEQISEKEVPVASAPIEETIEEEIPASSYSTPVEEPLFERNYTILDQNAKVTVYSDHAVLNTGFTLLKSDVESLARYFSSAYPVLKNLIYTLDNNTFTLYYPIQSEEYLSSALDMAEKEIWQYMQAERVATAVAKAPAKENPVAKTKAVSEAAPVVEPVVEKGPEEKEDSNGFAFDIKKLSVHTMLSTDLKNFFFKIGTRYDFTDHIAARVNIYNGFDAHVVFSTEIPSADGMSFYGGLGFGYSRLDSMNFQLFVGLEKHIDRFSAALELGFVNTRAQASAIFSYHFDNF